MARRKKTTLKQFLENRAKTIAEKLCFDTWTAFDFKRSLEEEGVPGA